MLNNINSILALTSGAVTLCLIMKGMIEFTSRTTVEKVFEPLHEKKMKRWLIEFLIALVIVMYTVQVPKWLLFTRTPLVLVIVVSILFIFLSVASLFIQNEFDTTRIRSKKFELIIRIINNRKQLIMTIHILIAVFLYIYLVIGYNSLLDDYVVKELAQELEINSYFDFALIVIKQAQAANTLNSPVVWLLTTHGLLVFGVIYIFFRNLSAETLKHLYLKIFGNFKDVVVIKLRDGSTIADIVVINTSKDHYILKDNISNEMLMIPKSEVCKISYSVKLEKAK